MTIAPMSVYTANSLKEKLLKGIDSEGNVVDMGIVLDVLKILESFELSKDDLEETRIGRYVNSMRKRTNDNTIAKKSKSLIKKWQAVVEQAVTASSVVSGSHSNPGMPSCNHRRKPDDNESVANSNCDSPSPVSSSNVGNGQSATKVASTTGAPVVPKAGLSLRIKLGKPTAAAPESNESSLSPALPSIKNGPITSGQPDKPLRRIKSTAEIAKELEQKGQLNLSNEIKEKLEKQRVEMPLQTINEPIPAPVSAHIFSNDRKQRGKKRGPGSAIEYDNPPSPRTMLLMSSLQSKLGADGNDDARSTLSTGSGGKLLSAEKSEMVKRFLDSSVTPSDMPLTPTSAHQSVTPEPDTTALPPEAKFVFPGDYSRLSTSDLYNFLSASFLSVPASTDDMEEEQKSSETLDVQTVRQPESRLPGITGIPAQIYSIEQEAEQPSVDTSSTPEVWTRWEDCVTLVSADADKRPIFILPFVDIPEDQLCTEPSNANPVSSEQEVTTQKSV